VIEPLSPQALAWVRQSAAVGLVTSQALLHLLERVAALEAAQQQPHKARLYRLIVLDRGDDEPTPEAAPVAAHPNHEDSEFTDQEWAEINRWRQESSDLQPAPPAATAGGLVERVGGAMERDYVIADIEGTWDAQARAAIREVAAWLDQQGRPTSSLMLREEADLTTTTETP